jgi:hypothetical protein
MQYSKLPPRGVSPSLTSLASERRNYCARVLSTDFCTKSANSGRTRESLNSCHLTYTL